MMLPVRHQRATVGGQSVSPHGLLSSLFAECTRMRRDQGRPPLTALIDVPVDQAIQADPVLIRRALEPLVRRAFESAAQPDSGREVPSLREVVVTSVDLGDAIEIEVADSGAGLSDAVRRWLCDAGDRPQADEFQAPSLPEGAGLALAAVRAAVARLGGSLRAANCPEGGVAITLRLPSRQSRRMAA